MSSFIRRFWMTLCLTIFSESTIWQLKFLFSSPSRPYKEPKIDRLSCHDGVIANFYAFRFVYSDFTS